jgi:alkanesulfonate monooxygenase SsuD/methylene tetrahydromethanopterin reductase-like flavin-dependent oxidoreductase (luciferase family)
MRIGLSLAIRNHPDQLGNLKSLYEDYIGDAVYAEELGFDGVWVGEHHFANDQWTPSVMPVLTAIAVQTSRIRLGSGVICLPFHDPLRLAEDAAVVDIISGGRLDLGVAIGSGPKEYTTFGIDRAMRSAQSFEAIDLIQRCFREPEPFDHEGTYYNYPEIDFTTKPLQQDVPIWWGGFGPQNVRRAAKRGFHLLADVPYYDPALTEFGHDPQKFHQGGTGYMHLAETRDQAWDEAQDGIHWAANFYRVNEIQPAGMNAEGPLFPLPGATELRDIPGFSVFGPACPVGTPQDALDILLPIKEGRYGRVSHMTFVLRHPGMETPQVRRSMDMFAEHVLPHLR